MLDNIVRVGLEEISLIIIRTENQMWDLIITWFLLKLCC